MEFGRGKVGKDEQLVNQNSVRSVWASIRDIRFEHYCWTLLDNLQAIAQILPDLGLSLEVNTIDDDALGCLEENITF